MLKPFVYGGMILVGVVVVGVLISIGVHLAAYEADEVLVVDAGDAALENDEAVVYRGASDASSEGHVGYVLAEVTVEDGELTAVSLTEFDTKGVAKGDDYYYDPWHEAMEQIPARILEAGGTDVEVVSGATLTSGRAIQAVDRALKQYEGAEGPYDGTFMGTSERNGSWGLAFVTIEDGEITAVELEEISDGELKDEDYIYDQWHEARQEMAGWFVEADSAEVDIFTGATSSAQMWKAAVENALINAGR